MVGYTLELLGFDISAGGSIEIRLNLPGSTAKQDIGIGNGRQKVKEIQC